MRSCLESMKTRPSAAIDRRLQTGNMIALTLSLVFFHAAGSASAQRPREPDVVRWPSPAYPTLQSAIDATPAGGRLVIAPGEWRVDVPLVIDKQLAIQGAGCRIPRVRRWLRRAGPSGRRPRRETRLVGPPPNREVPAENARGLVTYQGGGGVLWGVALSGFDVGVLVAGGDREADAVSLTEVCIRDTGRGVLVRAPVSVTIGQSVIRDVLLHGVSVAPVLASNVKALLFLHNTLISNAGQACAFFQGSTRLAGAQIVNVQDTVLLGCLAGGIVAAGSTAVTVSDVFIGSSTVSGITLFEVASYNIATTTIQHIHANAEGLFGDGVINVASGNGVGNAHSLSHVTLAHTDRAGLAVFGGSAHISDVFINCTPIDIIVEQFFGFEANIPNGGNNACGCTATNDPLGTCIAVTVSGPSPTPPDP